MHENFWVRKSIFLKFISPVSYETHANKAWKVGYFEDWNITDLVPCILRLLICNICHFYWRLINTSEVSVKNGPCLTSCYQGSFPFPVLGVVLIYLMVLNPHLSHLVKPCFRINLVSCSFVFHKWNAVNNQVHTVCLALPAISPLHLPVGLTDVTFNFAYQISLLSLSFWQLWLQWKLILPFKMALSLGLRCYVEKPQIKGADGRGARIKTMPCLCLCVRQ